MTDRYEDGIRELRGAAPPEQWDDIERRAAGELTVLLDRDPGKGGRRRWPTVLAVAAALALLAGGVTLVLRTNDNVTTSEPASTVTRTPDQTETPPHTAPPSTATTPTTSKLIAPGPPTRAAVACPKTLRLTTHTPPAGWRGTLQPATRDDPRVPAIVWEKSDVIGVFPGFTTTRAVFVVAGLPRLVEAGFDRMPGPFPGTEVAIAPYPDGAYGEVPLPRADGEDCWITLIAIGMTPHDLRAFVGGLTVG